MGSTRIKEAFGWWLPTYDTLFSHPNGVLGNNKEKINDLIRRML